MQFPDGFVIIWGQENRIDATIETWQKELVMCRNCKHFDSGFYVCHNPRFGDGYANYPPPSVNEEFYCEDGERKEKRCE